MIFCMFLINILDVMILYLKIWTMGDRQLLFLFEFTKTERKITYDTRFDEQNLEYIDDWKSSWRRWHIRI